MVITSDEDDNSEVDSRLVTSALDVLGGASLVSEPVGGASLVLRPVGGAFLVLRPIRGAFLVFDPKGKAFRVLDPVENSSGALQWVLAIGR